MRLLITVIFLFLIVSCTTTNQNLVVIEQYHYNYIDSAFHPIVEMFIYEAKSRGRLVDLTNLSMTFGNIRSKKTDKTVGYCARDPLGGMTIKIHIPTWKVMDEYQKEELIFHELAHCLIGRDHCKKKNKHGPISMMFPKLLDSGYYRENREDLLDELFNISPECVGDDGRSNEIDGSICSPAHRETKW